MVHLSVLHQKVIAVNEIVLGRGGEGRGGGGVKWERKGGGKGEGRAEDSE